MITERVLGTSPLVLDQRARERYFEDGFLTVPGYVGDAWLERLRRVVAAKMEESRSLSASDDQFDLAPDHTPEKPNIRRLRKAVDQHPERRHQERVLDVVVLRAQEADQDDERVAQGAPGRAHPGLRGHLLTEGSVAQLQGLA